MSFAVVDVELRYGWREWVKTPTGWVLASLESGTKPQESPTSGVLSNVSSRHSESKAKKRVTDSCHPIFVRGTRGQRHVSVCLSDMLKFLGMQQAAVEVRRSAYVCQVLHVLMKDYLHKISGTSQRQLFQMLEIITLNALESEQHIDRVKKLLVTTLKSMTDLGSNRVGCSSLWNKHIQTVTNLSSAVEEFEVTQREEDEKPMLTDLPKECIREIMLRLSDHRDLVHLGQCNLDLYYMSLDPSLWERLSQCHFSEKQMLNFMSEEDFGECTDWGSIYQKCNKKYGLKKIYADMLALCSKCKVIHWMMDDHCCLDEEKQVPDIEQISPEELIEMLRL